MVKNAIQAIELLNFDVSTMTGNYDAVGVLPNACFLIKMFNHSNRDMLVSFDAVHDNEALPIDYTFELRAGSTTGPIAGFTGLFPAGMRFYVKGTVGAGPSGNIYVSGYYLQSVV